MPKKNEPELTPKPYIESGNIEAHIIADMLRIESITAELKEFKEVTKDRLNKLERTPKVFALGGIRKNKMKRLTEAGFDGVALLGSIWGSRDPLRALNEFLKMDNTSMINNRQIV